MNFRSVYRGATKNSRSRTISAGPPVMWLGGAAAAMAASGEMKKEEAERKEGRRNG